MILDIATHGGFETRVRHLSASPDFRSYGGLRRPGGRIQVGGDYAQRLQRHC
jgi:hypothetical protein